MTVAELIRDLLKHEAQLNVFVNGKVETSEGEIKILEMTQCIRGECDDFWNQGKKFVRIVF